jgi:ketosteroid isomerase-like protein
MGQRDEFLEWVHTRLRDAEVALHNGDIGPRRQLWTDQDPVTLFGAWFSATGTAEVRSTFTELATHFAECTAYRFEVVAAEVSGDLAYTVGYEYSTAAIDGEPRGYVLRATQVYRREEGEWRVVHRHADPIPQALPTGTDAGAGGMMRR